MLQHQEIAGSRISTGIRRALLWAVFVLAAVATAAIAVLGSIPVIQTLTGGGLPLELVVAQVIQPGGNSGMIATQSYDSASIVLANFSQKVMALATAAALAQILTQAALAALAALVVWRLLHPRPFRRSLSAVTTLGGAVVLLGGVLAQGLGAFTHGVAVAELNGSPVRGFWPFAGSFDPSFLAVGVVLILVGLAFRHGEHLQHDTEGLI
ncbi:MAG: hypothetical protein WBX27_17805 [Specibacter sp.]